jgi:hypothetical protein
MEKEEKKTNIIDIGSARAVKSFIEGANSANDYILDLEDTLYRILDAKDLGIAKELAADVLGEDLETYNEADDLTELDFDDDNNLPWEDIKEEE